MKSYKSLFREFHLDLNRFRAAPLAVAMVAISLLVLQSNVLTSASANSASQVLNQRPVAVDDNYSTPTGVPIIIAAPGFLGNDRDADNDPLTVYSYSALQSASSAPGTIIINFDGSFMFDPAAGFTGIVSFTYRVGDQTVPASESFSLNEGTVSIEVTQPNNPPVADAGGPYSVVAGGTIMLDAGGSARNVSEL